MVNMKQTKVKKIYLQSKSLTESKKTTTSNIIIVRNFQEPLESTFESRWRVAVLLFSYKNLKK